jgi:hypothetical protein
MAKEARRAKVKKPGKPKKPKTYTDFGHTVDEAAIAAHGRIPENPNAADETIKSRVVEWGRETGGIVPLNRFYATVVKV